MRPLKVSEFKLHKSIVQLLRHAARADVIFYHIPNGEKRSAITGARLKAMGVRPGMADLAFVVGGRAAFLELKRPGSRPSVSQRWFADECERAGALYAVVDNIDDALAALREWGVINTAILPATAGCEGRDVSAVKSRCVPTNTRVSGVSA